MANVSGSVHKRRGKWWARITWKDPVSGKRRDTERAAPTRAEACALRDRLVQEMLLTQSRSIDRTQATFAELVDHIERSYVVPPTYVDERKVAGLRSWRDQRRILATLKQFFGARPVQSITYSEIREFRSLRLSTPVSHGGRTPRQRSIASVNRELAQLRRALNIAAREGWVSRNAFTAGESLISPSDERQRERILTREEEQRLLGRCGTSRRVVVGQMIICALDTGMRYGEIRSLRWTDVDFEKRLITIRAYNTKTMRARAVALTARLAGILRQRADCANGEAELVFGVAGRVKTAFNAIRREAGLTDVRFHDLRHTAATRLVRGGLPLAEVGRVLGHTQPATTFRYVNADAETASRAAEVLDAYVSQAPN